MAARSCLLPLPLSDGTEQVTDKSRTIRSAVTLNLGYLSSNFER